MPSSDPNSPDYECPSCHGPAYPCPCMPEYKTSTLRDSSGTSGVQTSVVSTSSLTEEAIKTAYRRRNQTYLAATKTAKRGSLTAYVSEKEPTRTIFARWVYEDNHFVKKALPPDEQNQAQEILAAYLSRKKKSSKTLTMNP